MQRKSDSVTRSIETSLSRSESVTEAEGTEPAARALPIPSAPGEIKWGTSGAPLISSLNYTFGDLERESQTSASTLMLRQLDSLSL